MFEMYTFDLGFFFKLEPVVRIVLYLDDLLVSVRTCAHPPTPPLCLPALSDASASSSPVPSRSACGSMTEKNAVRTQQRGNTRSAPLRVGQHLLLLLYFGGERGDFLRPLAGLALQESELLLEIGERLGGEMDGQAEVTDLGAQLLLLLLQMFRLCLAVLRAATQTRQQSDNVHG